MPYQFASEWGRRLCKKILLETLNEHPHDHQLDVITHALDRKDVLSITYTGSGKSGYIYMFVAVVNAIMADPELCPTAQFPRNPVVVVICPTISLEEDLELKMKKYRIDSMVLSKERREEYQRKGIDIFKAIETGSHRVLLMTPEMLTSPAFTALINKPIFRLRPIALMVDEVHLMYVWGRQFRTQYTQIGNARARFASNPRLPLVAFTATLRQGPTPETSPFQSVQRFLGLSPSHFHLVHRSCARYEMQITVRAFPHGKQSERYSELDWLLDAPGKTLVFCSSIRWGSKIASYLVQKARRTATANYPRTYNRLHSPEYNQETLEHLRNSASALVIATDTLSVGMDLSGIDLVVVIDPADIDDGLQKAGRAGRDPVLVPRPRVVLYLPNKTFYDPKSLLLEASASPGKRIDTTLPKLALAKCKVQNIDEQYGNNTEEIPCTCPHCTDHPRACFPLSCDCSGCVPELPKEIAAKAVVEKPKVSASVQITKVMREQAYPYLERFRDRLARQLTKDSRGEYDLPPIAVLSRRDMDKMLQLMQTPAHDFIAVADAWSTYLANQPPDRDVPPSASSDGACASTETPPPSTTLTPLSAHPVLRPIVEDNITFSEDKVRGSQTCREGQEEYQK
ncbi:P-loop containing nucleoside triphosphate hydrolase protein [Schizophyllum commune]